MVSRIVSKVLPFVLLACSAAFAQTYTASNVPFVCDAATAARVPLSASMLVCRGVQFGSSNIELFFWGSGRIELFTPSWSLGPYTSSLSMTEFTEPDPPYCDKINGNCASGKTDGTFAFNWSGTDSNGALHSGDASGTWYNKQICGGERCWYHPVLDSVSLTTNQ